MTSYGYARVSTTAQDPGGQVAALIAAGVPVANITVEHASGTRTDRPKLAELLVAVGEGDVLTVWRLDRLGRSTSHLIDTVNDLAAHGVEFRSLSERIDTTTAAGRMQLGIFSILASFERDLIAERTSAGLAAARASGKELGRRTGVHPKQVPLIHDLIAQGKSQRDIAVMTGLTRAVVGRVARNEIPSLVAYQPHASKESTMPEEITPREQERRRQAIADARHSSEMEGGRSNDAARADQDAYARGDLTIDELIERATVHTQR